MFKKRGFFIVFEGIEGSGKSYHCKKFYEFLKKKKIPATCIREPGGSRSAELIRKIILKGKEEKFNKFTDTLLYLAARSENFEHNIKPTLEKRKVLICDRFIDSTIAYQYHGFGINRNIIDKVNKYILKGIKPDLTILLYTSIKTSLSRVKNRVKNNRYDKFSSNFYNKVQKGYMKIAKNNKSLIKINTDLDKETIQKKIILQTKKSIKKWMKKQI